MSRSQTEFSMSTTSLHSNGSQTEDWDRSESDIQTEQNGESSTKPTITPRNSVVFPQDGTDETPGRAVLSRGGRTLSQLLKLHAEKGTEGNFSAEEASRIAEVLGQWINSGSSPYEGEDDFFTRDDTSITRSSNTIIDIHGRPRGQSESVVSRPSSATGAAIAA